MASAFLAACGDAGFQGDDDSTTNSELSSKAAAISIGSSQTTVRSDNSDSATITVTVLDANRAAVEGVSVTLSASAGQLSSSGGLTDSTGQVTADFSAGSDSVSNATATITASVQGISESSLPVQITGSTVAVAAKDSSDGTVSSMTSGESAMITVTAKDAGGNAVNGTAVTLATSGTGSATLAQTSGTTGVTGTFSTTLTATGAGDVAVTATALGDTDSATINVQGSTTAFQIIDPTTNPVVMESGTTRVITVAAPNSANVTFVTSHGTWAENGGSLYETSVTNGEATATLSADQAGTANVQIFDSADSSVADTLTVGVVVTQVESGSTITLQAESSTVAVSSTSNTYSTTLSATAKSPTGQFIIGAPVVFTLTNTTGGGEYVSPSYAVTGSDGTVQTTFTSGTNSSDSAGVTVTASLYNGTTVEATADQSITINQTPGSVVITRGTTIRSINDDTVYAQPMAVMVADSAGNAVAGQKVTLKTWPLRFITGYRDEKCETVSVLQFNNEDSNRNLTLDSGENVPLDEGVYGDINGDTDALDYRDDDVLTPANSAAGSVPTSVTTDSNGVANFELIYPKNSATWIVDEITATTQVSGSETTGRLVMRLPLLLGEECNLPHSPYNP